MERNVSRRSWARITIRVNKMAHDGLLATTVVGQHVAQHGHVVVGPGQPGRLGLAQP